MKKTLFVLLSMLVLTSMLLSACGLPQRQLRHRLPKFRQPKLRLRRPSRRSRSLYLI